MVHRTICIDPGHGGDDPGTSHGGLKESDLNLVIGLHVRRMLLGSGWPVDVVMTRDGDEGIGSLRTRNITAANFGADVVFPIHVNASVDDTAHGIRVFYWPSNKRALEIASAVARAAPKAVYRGLDTAVIPVNRSGYPAAKNVVGAYAATAVLVECGFATNPDDREYLQTPGAQYALTAAICAGVARDLEIGS